MKRFLLAALSATWLATCGVATAETRWDMPSPASENNLQSKILREFLTDLDARSSGAVKLTLHVNQSLIRQSDTLDALKRNVVSIAGVNAQEIANLSPLLTIHASPLLAQGYDGAFMLYQAQKPLLVKKLAEHNLILLFSTPHNVTGIFSPRPLNSINDMRDQFITSAIPQTKSLAERLGATFSATRPPAVPPEKFTITLASARDGADTQIWSQGMTHFYDVKAWIPQDLVLIRKDSFNSLNDSEKKAVTDAAQAAETRGWEMAKAEDTAAIKILQDNHIVVEGANGALGGELKTLGQTIAGERQQELEALGLVWPPRPAPAQP